MKPALRCLVFGCVSFIAAIGFSTSLYAQNYPERPVKLIVPYPPGATADLIGRAIAQSLSQSTGGQFYVENLPGAGGTIGTGAAARAPGDGHTLVLVNQDFVVQGLVKPKIPYDPLKSFRPVAALAGAPETISVHPSVAAAGMKDLIALLGSNPGNSVMPVLDTELRRTSHPSACSSSPMGAILFMYPSRAAPRQSRPLSRGTLKSCTSHFR